MRFIDKTNCKSGFEKGVSREVTSLGQLTKEAAKIAEARGLGLLKNRAGFYRVIRKSGLGAYEDFFSSLADVDAFLKNLK